MKKLEKGLFLIKLIYDFTNYLKFTYTDYSKFEIYQFKMFNNCVGKYRKNNVLRSLIIKHKFSTNIFRCKSSKKFKKKHQPN